jgi:hypothetical protein
VLSDLSARYRSPGDTFEKVTPVSPALARAVPSSGDQGCVAGDNSVESLRD